MLSPRLSAIQGSIRALSYVDSCDSLWHGMRVWTLPGLVDDMATPRVVTDHLVGGYIAISVTAENMLSAHHELDNLAC